MNDQFTQNEDREKAIDEQLRSIAEQTDAHPSFKSELEQRLMSAHQARSVSITPFFRQAPPVIGWTIGLAVLALFLNWVISSIAPTPPVPAADIATPTRTPIPVEPTRMVNAIPETSTPTGNGGHDWRGTKLYLAQQLPQSPVEANVYLKNFSEEVTRENILALAQRFRINGEIQEGPSDIPGQMSYTISDGKERLEVRSDLYFMYHSNFGEELYLDNLSEERAKIISDNFLKKHGFDFEYKFEHATNEHSPNMQGTHFYILPLTPDGYEMHFDYMQPVHYEILLDNTGENIIFSGYPIEFESVGIFGIITVEDALQKILDPNLQSGLMENFRGQGGGGGGSSFYQLNVSGTPVPFPTPPPKPGQENFEYIVQEGDTVFGIAQSYGITPEKIVQANDWLTEEHTLAPGKTLIIPGAHREQLRVGQRLEGERGIFQVNIFEESQRVWYGFFSTASDKKDWPYMILEGDDLNSLHQYNNLPVYIWGTIDRFDQNSRPVVKIEQYEFPFPDLKFQIIQGKQKIMAIQDRQLLAFTASNGTTYVQIGIADSRPLDEALLFDNEGEDLIAEVLIVPDETFDGFPVMRVYSLTYAFDPITGQPNELSIMANQFNTYSEPNALKDYVLPTATIEKVELVYYVRNPTFALVDPNAGPQYLQPAWRFYGHYSNGDEFEILVQALEEEFLLPEPAPYTPPG